MAYITLRQSRGTRNYYLVESYRDEEGRSRKRTLCYLGREQDGTDTLEKAISHWRRIEETTNRALSTAPKGRKPLLLDRAEKARQRVALLGRQAEAASRLEGQRRERNRRIEAEAEDHRRRAEQAEHWQAIERLQRSPSPENAQAAKRAFRTLALRLHPDQGGSHEEFIRLKAAYDRAEAQWRRKAG